MILASHYLPSDLHRTIANFSEESSDCPDCEPRYISELVRASAAIRLGKISNFVKSSENIKYSRRMDPRLCVRGSFLIG